MKNLCLESKATQKKPSKHNSVCWLGLLTHYTNAVKFKLISEVIEAAGASMQLFPIRYTDKKQSLTFIM